MKKITLMLLTLIFVISIISGAFADTDGCQMVTKEIYKEADFYVIKVKYPQMEGFSGQDSQDGLNNKISTRIESSVKDYENWVNQSPPDPNYPSNMKWDMVIDYKIIYKTEKIVSIFFENYSYTGGAHGNNYSWSVNYDLEKNYEIQLPDLFLEKSDYLNFVSDYCITEVKKKQINDDMDWIKEGAGPKEDNFKTFNLTEKSLIITFDPYAVACYAAGRVEVEIPYEAINDFIDNDGPIGKIVNSK